MSSPHPSSKKQPSAWTNWLRQEDLVAISLGAFILLAGLSTVYISWQADNHTQAEPASHPAYWKSYHLTTDVLYRLTTKPGTWASAPWETIVGNDQRARNQYTMALEKSTSSELDSTTVAAPSEHLLKAHEALFPKSFNRVPWLLTWFIVLAGVFGLVSRLPGGSVLSFTKGFAYLFLFSLLAYLLAGQINMKILGIGYAFWAILLGLLIANTVGTPSWVKPALQTELYIKTGLVLLGAEILLGKLLAIGVPGIFVAWVVTPIVLITTYWFGQKVLKIKSKTLNMVISADMSVCGVSAAVATAAACKAKQEELIVAVGLSMAFTSVMMVVLPQVIRMLDMPEILGGAWIGGTLDATGAVVAAGAFLGEQALFVAATIKMIQNILIGFIAFGVAAYFSKTENPGARIGISELWKRFPKFILGFLGASLVFSLLYEMGDPLMQQYVIEEGVIGRFSKNVRGWLFCLAFVSIGLSTNFKTLSRQLQGGKPLVLYLTGQSLNLVLTLLMAYLMFYVVFPDITEQFSK